MRGGAEADGVAETSITLKKSRCPELFSANGDPLTSLLFWLVAEVASQRPNQSPLTILGG